MIRATTVDKHLQDLQRVLDSIPKMEVTRRGLVMSALATGFALAVQPVSAETVTTDADYRPSYRKEQAQDGWKRLQAWFKQHDMA